MPTYGSVAHQVAGGELVLYLCVVCVLRAMCIYHLTPKSRQQLLLAHLVRLKDNLHFRQVGESYSVIQVESESSLGNQRLKKKK
jgi:hypothetical protein